MDRPERSAGLPPSVAVVTGAASGLGRATALELARAGAAIAVLDVNAAGAWSTVADIESSGGAALALQCDVAQAPSVRVAIDACIEQLGTPSLVCNAAALQQFAHTHELTVDDWSRILGVTLSGTFLVCQATISAMLDAGTSGAIVNVASTAGLAGLPYDAAYCAAKGGVVQLTRSLAVEYARRGIRINAVAPGGMDTPMLHVPFPDGVDQGTMSHIRRSMLGVAAPDEVAGVIAFLLSDRAGSMTGAVVPVDGGALA